MKSTFSSTTNKHVKKLAGLLLPLGVLAALGGLHAQPTVSLKKDDLTLHPLVSKTDTLVYQPVKLRLDLSGDAPTDGSPAKPQKIEIPVKANIVRSSVAPTVLAPEKITIEPADWPGAGKDKTVEKIIVLQTRSVPKFTTDELFYLTLDGSAVKNVTVKSGDDNNLQVRVTTVGVYDRNKSFWLEVGANFDLVDGLQPNNFFSGVFFHKRDIRPLISGKEKNIGIFAGIYESKTLTLNQEKNFSLQNFYDSTSFIPNVPDSVKVYKGIGNYVNRRVVRNIGLFFSPQLRLSTKSANEDGLHFFTSLWFDLQWQRIEEETTFSLIRKQDSFRIPVSAIGKYNTNSAKKVTDIRSHYIGIGFPVFYRESFDQDDIVHLFVNPVFGATNQPTRNYLFNYQAESGADGISNVTRSWRPFYIVQFRLNEEKYGISFTGEVRGLITDNNPPLVTLALSKKFDLTKFMEFNK